MTSRPRKNMRGLCCSAPRAAALAAALLACTLGSALAKSEELSPKDFKKTVIDSKDAYMV